MADFLKFLRKDCPDALTGRIGRDPIRILSFDLAQLDHQLIILGVADERRVEHVITVIMGVNLLLEFFVALFGRRSVHCDSRFRVWKETG